jgi:cyclopropane-fatty-acyl-phospholipid synthase
MTAATPSPTYSSMLAGTLSRLAAPAYGPAVAIARQACLSLFSRLDSTAAHGVLEIVEQNGTLAFGDPVSKRALQRKDGENVLHAVLHVKSDTFWLRLALGSDLGFAEAYMLQEVETPNLGDCFAVFIANREVLSDLSIGLLSKLSSYAQSLLNRRYANTKRGSLRNIGAHYDISNRMYEAFLSRDMTYSCAVFPTLDADLLPTPATSTLLKDLKAPKALRPSPASPPPGIAPGVRYSSSPVDDQVAASSADGQLTPPDSVSGRVRSPVLLAADELEDGQLRKIRLHLDRAALQSHHRMLEIGTGWGALAMEAVRSSGCSVDSLTLSVEQKALAEKRIAAAGMSDKITVHLMDYRDMPEEWNGRFDRIVSVEMLEAVGIEFLSTYFHHVDRTLKRDGGVCVVQVITMPEERFDAYINQVDFIRKWIFPGGVLPSVTALVDAATKGAHGRLVLDTVHSIGPHYARTLREWRTRFERHFDQRIAPALLDDHAEIRHLPAAEKQRQIQVFKRKWIYYFVYCEVGFTERVIGDHILSFTRSGNRSLPVCSI